MKVGKRRLHPPGERSCLQGEMEFSVAASERHKSGFSVTKEESPTMLSGLSEGFPV